MADLSAYDEVVIQGPTGSNVTVTNNRLDVNAQLTAITDPILEGLVTVEHTHYEIHEGNSFSVTGYNVGIQSGASTNYLIQTSSTVYPHLTYSFQTSLSAVVYIYEAPTVTANGSALTIVNRNRPLAATHLPLTEFYLSPTVTADGSLLETTFIGGSNQSAGSAKAEIEFVLKTSTKYLIRITSLNNNNAYGFNFVWYGETQV